MRFQPGQSGNPGGRPKSDFALGELARKHTRMALACIVSIMQDADASPVARVRAAEAILDRGYGKPGQSLDVNASPLVPDVAAVMDMIAREAKMRLSRLPTEKMPEDPDDPDADHLPALTNGINGQRLPDALEFENKSISN
ncbi:MAG: DUF5681 domain-containing protein [Opitutaceae bacterium]|jgi:hypothetical protein